MPPVETISTPSSARPRAKSTMPRLVGHRQQRPAHAHLAGRGALDPGAASARRARSEAMRRAYPSPAPSAADRRSRAAGCSGSRAQRAAREQAHGLAAAARARAGAAPRAPRSGVARVGQLDRALQDHRARCRRRRRRSARSRRTPSRRRRAPARSRCRPGNAGSSEGCTLMTAPGKRSRKAAPSSSM